MFRVICISERIDLLSHFFREKVSFEILFIFHNFERVDEGGVSQACVHRLEALDLSGHVNSEDLHSISRRALARSLTLADHIYLSRNVADGDLVAGLLELDLLVAHKLTLLHLDNELSLHIIFHANCSRTLDHRCELLARHNLVNFETTSVTCVNGNLHAGFDVADLGDNTFDRHHGSNRVCFDFSQLYKMLLGTWGEGDVVLPLKLGGNPNVLLLVRVLGRALRNFLLESLSCVEPSLLHYDVES